MRFYFEEIKERGFEENLYSGILSCQGCGAPIAMRHVLRVLGKNTVFAIPACCWTIIDGNYPMHSLKVPLLHVAFETAAISAVGIKAGLEVKGFKDVNVVAWAGDGGTYDIGIQALSGAAERGDDIIYICYDNEAYMNTGIQRSGSTPYKAWTTTTPYTRPNPRPKKDIIQIMAAHKIPYIATISIAYLNDLIRKTLKAKNLKGKGLRFLLIYSPCPPGWRLPSSEITVKIARLAVETNFFPLYEIEDGEKYTLNFIPDKKPLKEFIKLQGRFKHLKDEEIEEMEETTQKNFERILNLHRLTHGNLDNIPKGFYK